MQNRILGLIMACILLAIMPAGCSTSGEGAEPAEAETAQTAETEDSTEEEIIEMKMTINDTPVTVAWENNESVRALAEMAGQGPVTITTSPYGGFEQVGSIGATLPSDDTDITTVPGDIMLYTSSNMVIFYGSNSWAYTRLGRITDKSDQELKELLGGSGVTVTITAE